MKKVADETIIVRLEIRNVQRIRAGVWDLGPGLQRLTSGGKNRQGKTTVLRAIRMLFEGAGAVPPEPVNADADLTQDEAFVKAWLSDGWTICRTFTEAGKSYLHVVGPDGGRHGQSRIDDWTSVHPGRPKKEGAATFNPLSFFALKPAEQAEVLLGLSSDPDLKAKLDQNAAEEAELYEKRTDWIRDQRRYSAVPEPEGPRPDPIDVSAEMKRLGELQAIERELQDAVRSVDRARDAARRQAADAQRNAGHAVEKAEAGVQASQDIATRAAARVLALRRELELAEAEANRASQGANDALRNLAAAKDALAALETADAAAAAIPDPTDLPPDPADEMAEVRARIEMAGRRDQELRPWKDWDEAQILWEEAKDGAQKLTARIDKVREARAAILAAASFPIEGLDFSTAGHVLLNEHPLEQASGREGVELCVMAAIAANPRLRTILVDEGNDLDAEGLERLAELAKEHHLQVILARLGIEGRGELEVIDGMSVAPPPAEAAEATAG